MNSDRPSARQGNRAGVQLGVDEAIGRIGRRARVYVAQGSATPLGLLAAIDAAHDELSDTQRG